MRDDEELCKKCFDRYLVDSLGLRSRAWREGEDPPDYYLILGDRGFAVEVTNLIGELDTASGSISDEGYSAAVREITKTIESRAIEQGILRGTYVISFRGPFDELGVIRGLVESRALGYIRDTPHLRNAPYHPIFPQGATGCGIQKTHDDSDTVTYGISSLGWFKWEGELEAEAGDLLRNAVSIKRRKLEHITRSKILLLLNRFPFGEPQLYEKCARSAEMAELMDCFHSVFVAQNEREGYLLHTREEAWRAASNRSFTRGASRAGCDLSVTKAGSDG